MKVTVRFESAIPLGEIYRDGGREDMNHALYNLYRSLAKQSSLRRLETDVILHGQISNKELYNILSPLCAAARNTEETVCGLLVNLKSIGDTRTTSQLVKALEDTASGFRKMRSFKAVVNLQAQVRGLDIPKTHHPSPTSRPWLEKDKSLREALKWCKDTYAVHRPNRLYTFANQDALPEEVGFVEDHLARTNEKKVNLVEEQNKEMAEKVKALKRKKVDESVEDGLYVTKTTKDVQSDELAHPFDGMLKG